jgi:hypothetical protein
LLALLLARIQFQSCMQARRSLPCCSLWCQMLLPYRQMPGIVCNFNNRNQITLE